MTKGEAIKRVREVLKAIADQCKLITQYVISNSGVNDKVGEDTLTFSNLYNDVETKLTDEDVVEFFAPEYIKWVEKGRIPRDFSKQAKKTFPWVIALDVLTKWAERKGLPTDNRTIYFIWKSILERGIKPRPIFTMNDTYWTDPANTYLVEDAIEEYWKQWEIDIAEAIFEDIDKEFND
jgi:hypothetical protein